MAPNGTRRRKDHSNGNAAPKDKTDDAIVIDNPFMPPHMKTPRVAKKAGRRFAEDHHLETKADLFEKAALVLHDPPGFRSLDELSDDERVALVGETGLTDEEINSLADETNKKNNIWSLVKRVPQQGLKELWQGLFPRNGLWKQPRALRSTVFMLCNAAVVQGWCQASINGANLNWARELLDDIDCNPTGINTWIFAAVNAAPYLTASLLGCWLSDPLSERLLGRRAPIAVSAITIIATSIGSAFTKTWPSLLACRILLGLGMGTKATVVPVFAAEIAPAHLRGSLVMNWQLFDALGIFFGFTANLIAGTVGQNAWRWQLASVALPAMILLGQLAAAPESPRFLMKKKDYKAAFDSFLVLRREPILAAKELLYAYEQTKVERNLLSLSPPDQDTEQQRGGARGQSSTRKVRFQKLRLMFFNKRTRRALLAAMVVMISQQLCGINILMFYSSTVYGNDKCGQEFRGSPNEHLTPLFLSWGVGLTNFLFAIPAYWLIERRGRRWLLVMTLPFMIITLLAASFSFLIPDRSPAHAIVVGLFTYLFVAIYSVGMGPVPFTYSAECFPLEVRMVGMSIAVFTDLLGAGILALFVPVLTAKLTHSGLLGLFAGLNLIAFILIFLFVPETSGAAIRNDRSKADDESIAMSLEELNYIFDGETRRHVKYQWNVVLKGYVLKKYIRRQKNTPRPPKFWRWPDQGDGESQKSSDETAAEHVENVDGRSNSSIELTQIGQDRNEAPERGIRR